MLLHTRTRKLLNKLQLLEVQHLRVYKSRWTKICWLQDMPERCGQSCTKNHGQKVVTSCWLETWWRHARCQTCVTKELCSSTVCKLDNATTLHPCFSIHGLLEASDSVTIFQWHCIAKYPGGLKQFCLMRTSHLHYIVWWEQAIFPAMHRLCLILVPIPLLCAVLDSSR